MTDSLSIATNVYVSASYRIRDVIAISAGISVSANCQTELKIDSIRIACVGVSSAALGDIDEKIPISTGMYTVPTLERIRWFGDIPSLAAESVDISRGINDTMWVLQTSIVGQTPTEFFHYAYATTDHNNVMQTLFAGFTPDSVDTYQAIQHRSHVSMYDYGWYLSAQYLPEDAYIISLQGIHSSWDAWIRYLLEGTGILPYRISISSAEDKEFSFSANTTKRDAIDAISQYCGFVFMVRWNAESPPDPIAYWVSQDHIDDGLEGLDIPAPVTFSYPDSYIEEISAVQSTPEEKINRVRVRGCDTAGMWYSSTVQTPALVAGEDIAREYYEESNTWDSQLKTDARALALLDYFTSITHTVELKIHARVDLRLYQRIRFTGAGFPSRLTSLGWLRIIWIQYHISGVEKYVSIRACTDKGVTTLTERMNIASTDVVADIDTIVSDKINTIPSTELGTVEQKYGDIVSVRTEEGRLLSARAVGNLAVGDMCEVIHARAQIIALPIGGGGGTGNHSQLNELNWSIAGHAIDANIDMRGNTLTTTVDTLKLSSSSDIVIRIPRGRAIKYQTI